MKLAHSFTLPEQAPIVPERLTERITDWLPGATKIDVKIGRSGLKARAARGYTP